MRPSSLAVIGLGAMGGSLAWQARQAGVPRVVGYSPSRADGVQARPLVLLSGEQGAYYERRGARRVAPANGPLVGTQVSSFDESG